MSAERRPIVLDAWAVLAYLGDEPGGREASGAIADALEAGAPVLMSVVNAAEVWYTIARQGSAREADDMQATLGRSGVTFVAADWELSRDAARFKSQHKMSLADCYAASLALRTEGTLLTGDPDFRQVEDEVEVQWL